MRRLVLAALCLTIAGCGDEDVVESGACASAIRLHGELYWGASISGVDLPPPGEPLDGGIAPACNDTWPPFEEDRDVRLREVRGVPPEVAVYAERDPETIFMSDRYRVFLPMPGYRRRARGERCRIAGTVAELESLRVGERTISVDGRTRMDGFPGTLPYLRKGDRVLVDAVGCRGRGVVARRIALQP